MMNIRVTYHQVDETVAVIYVGGPGWAGHRVGTLCNTQGIWTAYFDAGIFSPDELKVPYVRSLKVSQNKSRKEIIGGMNHAE